MTIHNHNFEQLLDSTDAANFLKVNPKTLQSLARAGQLPGIKVGKQWRFQQSALNRWIRSKAKRK